MPFQQPDNSDCSQPDAFRSDNVEDTTKSSIQSSRTRPSAPQDSVSRGVFGSSNSGSESDEWMFQQPVNWIVAHSSPPSGKPHPDNHELCRHEELFCVHAPDGLEASRNNSRSASNCVSLKDERKNSDIHVQKGHQHTTENQMPAVVVSQVLEPLQSNTVQRLQHQTHHLTVPGIVNGNGKTQLHLHIQPLSEDRRYMKPNGSPYFQGHGYIQSTDFQSQPPSKAGTSENFDPGMYNMQVLPSNHPVGDYNNHSGQFLEFQLLDRATAAAQVDMSGRGFKPTFKTGRIDMNHPRAQVAPPRTAQCMSPWQPVQRVLPVQPSAQHMASWHPAQYTAPLQSEQYTETSHSGRPSSQTIIAPKVVLAKRKTRTDPEYDVPKAKKTKTTAPHGRDIPADTLRPKKAARKQKYTAIAGVLDAELPDYRQVALSYATRDAAAAAAAQKLADPLVAYFRSANKDDSIPKTDDERLEIVRKLFGAMKDVSRANDIDSPVVQSRWGADAGKSYDDVDIEATCWEIVNLAERLHVEGPSALSIRDPNYVTHIKNCADLTFIQRMRVITTIAFQWKARCDGLIKGDTVQTLVAAPLEALQSAVNNWKANKERTSLYKFAKNHQDGPKKSAPKSKTGRKTEPNPTSRQVDEAGQSFSATSSYCGNLGSSQSNKPDQQVDEAGPSYRSNPSAPREVGSIQMNEGLQPGGESETPHRAEWSSAIVFGSSQTNEAPQQDHEAGLSSQINSSSLGDLGSFEMSEPLQQANENGLSSQSSFGDGRCPQFEESFDSFDPFEPFEPSGSQAITGTPLPGYSDRPLDKDFL